MFIYMLDQSIIEITQQGTFIVHATAGKVEWIYNDAVKMFCYKN